MENHIPLKNPVNEELTLREITAPDGYEIGGRCHIYIERYNGSPESRNERCQNTGENNRKNKCTKKTDNQKIWAFVLLALASAGTATGVTVYCRKKSKMTDKKKKQKKNKIKITG